MLRWTLASMALAALATAGCSSGGGGGASGDAVVTAAQDGGGTPTGAGTTSPPADATIPPAGEGNYFPAGTPWTQVVEGAAVDPSSGEIIAWLNDQGWGLGRLQIDFSIVVLSADESTPLEQFEPTGDFYTPDCDQVPVPLPDGGRLEGETGYECTSDGDCHLIVRHTPTNTLYEMWRANISGGTFYGGCLAVWDLGRVYGPKGRGEQCTSADAAGFPIAPLLFSADEVAGGAVEHAIRFILPNPRMRAGVYVRPATHAGGPSGPDTAPPYGVRLRLRADYPMGDLPNDAARVVARAMQKYGMLLADGGSVALTAQSDVNTTAKWEGLLEPRDLDIIQPSDFEVIELGEIIELTYDCVREPF